MRLENSVLFSSFFYAVKQKAQPSIPYTVLVTYHYENNTWDKDENKF